MQMSESKEAGSDKHDRAKLIVQPVSPVWEEYEE